MKSGFIKMSLDKISINIWAPPLPQTSSEESAEQ